MKPCGQVQLVLQLVTLSLLALSCKSETYFVTPTLPPISDCITSEPCFTLSHYSRNAETLFNDKHNVSLQFLSGIHTLAAEDASFELFNIYSLYIKGTDSYYNGTSITLCTIEAAQVSIRNVSSLTIQNCHLVESLLDVWEVDSLTLTQFVFTNTTVFIANTDNAQTVSATFNFCSFLLLEVSKVFLSDSHFKSVSIRLVFTASSHSLLTLNKSIMYRSSLFLYLGNSNHVAAFESCSFSGQKSGIIGYVQPLNSSAESQYNAAFDVIKCTFSNDSSGIQLISGGTTEITVSECEFQRNQIGLSVTVQKGDFDALIQNTVFNMLNHDFGLQTYFFAYTELNEKRLKLKNVSYLHNNVDLFLGTLVLSGPLNLTIENCVFKENFGLISTLFMRSTNVMFRGTNSFTSNLGSTGGAMYMSHSTLWLDKGAEIMFQNNTAKILGGAIFLEEDNDGAFLDILFLAESKAKCFYQLPFNIESPSDLPAIVFVDNLADIGGNNIYGAALASDCEVTPNKTVISNQVKHQIFQFQTASMSPVSSTSKRVCLCENNVPQCDSVDYIFYNTSATSGEKFKFSLVLVGNDFGTVTGVIYASHYDTLIADHSLGVKQKYQQIVTNKECSNIEYSIHSESYEDQVTIFLSIDSITASSQRAIRNSVPFTKEALALASHTYKEKGIIDFNLLNVPVSITVNILPCPMGFTLHKTELVCHCENFFLEYAHGCRVENRTGIVLRNGTVWLSPAPSNENSSSSILAHRFCPIGHCKSNLIAINLDHPDEQCDYNHSGILCGGCLPGLSLAIGSSRCIQCSNQKHLSLFLIFVAAGMVLVFLIKILDLTVARGTINGLIFYANIIWINQSIFFPSGSDHNGYNVMKLYQMIQVCIAWLNLDFGIETCFIAGLDAYWKTWLQFSFPFYLWILAALIVVACHYSSVATKLFGNNAVAVLATIVMLSYVKLLRTIVTILSFANLQQYNPPGSKSVWLEDGNIPYLGSRHKVIFAAALLVLLLLCLPFTILLLLAPYLIRSSNSNVTKWMSKLKPLFDSFFGPFRDGHNYWIGLTLFIRLVLAIVAAAAQATYPTVIIDLTILTAVLLIILLNNSHKKTHNFVFELCFLINIFMTGIAYLSTTDRYSRVLITSVSGLIGFILFLAIIIVHLYTSLKALYLLWHKTDGDANTACVSNFTQSTKIEAKNCDDPSSFVTRTNIELRECILEP